MSCAYCRSKSQLEKPVAWADVEAGLVRLRAAVSHQIPLTVTFTGGEPTLRTDVIRELGVLKHSLPLTQFQIQTNGSFPGTIEFRRLLLNTFSQIMISIDTPRAGDVSQQLRTGTDNYTIWDNLSRLCSERQSAETKVGVVVTVCDTNRPCLSGIVADAASVGADWISFHPLRASMHDAFSDHCLSPDELQKVHAELIAIKRRDGKPTRIDVSMMELALQYLRGTLQDAPLCHAGNWFIYVANDMRVYPCCIVWPNHGLELTFQQAVSLLKRNALGRRYSSSLRHYHLSCCLECLYYNNMMT